MRKIIGLLMLGLLLMGCGEGRNKGRKADENQGVYVSILPLKGLTEAIVGPHIEVKVLVPAGASPESFEPTPRQLVDLAEAKVVLSIGLLDFERELLTRLAEEREVHFLNEGIELLSGSCAHHHTHTHHHAHGIDPHIWSSPRELRTLSKNLYLALQEAYPDSLQMRSRYEALDKRIAELDTQCAQALNEAHIEAFLIYHPALSYYARAYGIEQMAIEHEGKEPSAKRLAELIDRGRTSAVHHILYQSQFPATSVEVIAQDLQTEAVAIDPLAEDILAEIERITHLICNSKK